MEKPNLAAEWLRQGIEERKANVAKLEGDLKTARAEISEFERALKVLAGAASPAPRQSPSGPRKKSRKPSRRLLISQKLQSPDYKDSGLSVSEIVGLLAKEGVTTTKGSVSTLLAELKKQGKVEKRVRGSSQWFWVSEKGSAERSAESPASAEPPTSAEQPAESPASESSASEGPASEESPSPAGSGSYNPYNPYRGL